MARAPVSSWLREPLLQFVLLGVAAAGGYAVTRSPNTASERDQIVLTEADIAWLQTSWERKWQRAPTPDELRSLLDGHVREEILYREAIRLGLDRDDPVVRRRLATKLEFLAKDLGAALEPTDAELRGFLEENRARYEVDAERSFAHVYLNADRRGERTMADAEELLTELRAADASAEAATERGDRILLRSTYPSVPHRDVAREFGAEFADALFELEPGTWSGPIRSGYGVHLVRVFETTPARLPAFEEVRDRIREDLVERRRQQNLEAFYAGIRARYDVEIELADR